MKMSFIVRPALGSKASIGNLYDATNDTFCNSSIFQKIPRSQIIEKDINSKIVSVTHGVNFGKMAQVFELGNELTVSILSGMTNVEGIGLTICDPEFTEDIIQSSLIYKVSTKQRMAEIGHNWEDVIDTNAITNTNATHVVMGITWGGTSILSFFYNQKNSELKRVLERLEKELHVMIKTESDQKSAVHLKLQKELSCQIYQKFTYTTDVDPTSPKSVVSALELIVNFPGIVRTCKDKENHQAYHLLPLQQLKADNMGSSIQAKMHYKCIKSQILDDIVLLFKDASRVHSQIKHLSVISCENSFCVSKKSLAKINNLQKSILQIEEALTMDLSKKVRDVRRGKCQEGDIQNLIHRFSHGKNSIEAVKSQMSECTCTIKKINFIKSVQKLGGVYIGLETSLDKEKDRNNHANDLCYVLSFMEEASKREPEIWEYNSTTFLEKMKKKVNSLRFYAVDCDLCPKYRIENRFSCIQITQSSKVLVEDLYMEHKRTPLATTSRNIRDIDFVKPRKMTPLEIPCPGTKCNSSIDMDWKCDDCFWVFDYGFDNNVYCACGKSPATHLKFRCNDPNHGTSFESYSQDKLTSSLSQLRPLEKLNILILGETGVGKSTWINGFVNFNMHEKLADAEKGKLVTIIPSEFTVCGKNFEQIVVSTGNDDNECHETGQSATQEAKVHQFRKDRTLIRLIDTPGIGDTRGIEQDKKNFESTLKVLSNLDEIHGICILLKPNNARLTVMFRFCIKELLTNLHRDASKNILFCFTNSRSTFYRPGDTLPALKKLLKENKEVDIPLNINTIYCFDSEAYRFLAAVKNKTPVLFSEEERTNFATSWEKSIEETNRMMAYIKIMKPHSAKSTINLNKSRELILSLARPMAEISRNVHTNKAIIRDKIKEISTTEENIEELMKNKMAYRTEIEVVRLDYPKTVCSNSNCVKLWKMNNVTTTEYITICHGHCYLQRVTADSVGHPNLTGCSAMSNEICRRCNHHYREHLHIYYDSKQVFRQVEDQSVVEMLQQNLSAKEMKRRMITDKEKEIKELETELHEIELSSAKFAYFLKTNAITPYNDTMEEYLNHLIREEKNKISSGSSRAPLEGLIESKDSYINQKCLLEKEMKKHDAENILVEPAEVEQLVRKLEKLKHSGRSLTEALQCITYGKNVVFDTVAQRPIKIQHQNRPIFAGVYQGYGMVVRKIGSYFRKS